MEVAAQIPYRHPSHGRLVRLLECFTQSPQMVSRTTLDGDMPIFVNYQALGEKLRDNWQGESLAGGRVPRDPATSAG